MKAYATAAFARFARRRLVREATWFHSLGGEDEAAVQKIDGGRSRAPQHVSQEHYFPVGEDRGFVDGGFGAAEAVDSGRIQLALERLPTADRQILAARYAEGLSERELGREHGMTRYGVRDLLAKALLRLSVQLGESGVLDERELKVARALFCEGHTLRDVAASFELTEPQVRQLRKRMLQAIGQAIGDSK